MRNDFVDRTMKESACFPAMAAYLVSVERLGDTWAAVVYERTGGTSVAAGMIFGSRSACSEIAKLASELPGEHFATSWQICSWVAQKLEQIGGKLEDDEAPVSSHRSLTGKQPPGANPQFAG